MDQRDQSARALRKPKQRRVKSREEQRRLPEPYIRRVFRHNLRNRRVQVGYSQDDLAEILKVTQEFISLLESPRSRKRPSLPLLHEIAMALGCHAHEMLELNKFTGKVDGDMDLRTTKHQGQLGFGD